MSQCTTVAALFCDRDCMRVLIFGLLVCLSFLLIDGEPAIVADGLGLIRCPSAAPMSRAPRLLSATRGPELAPGGKRFGNRKNAHQGGAQIFCEGCAHSFTIFVTVRRRPSTISIPHSSAEKGRLAELRG